MKRISILSVLVLLAVSIPATARDYFYTQIRYRTRWSPYSQGLISGHVEYSPYALSSNNDGLVSITRDYSPYALTYGGNGIVSEFDEYLPYALSYDNNGLTNYQVVYTPYALSPDSSGLVHINDSIYCTNSKMNLIIRVSPSNNVCSNNSLCNLTAQIKESREEKKADQKALLEERKIHLAKINKDKQNDPAEIIHQFLKSENIKYRTTQNFKVEGKTISVDFILANSNTVIKFWNITEITEIKKNDDYINKRFDKYYESWKEYCKSYLTNDIKICHILPVDNDDLLAQLARYEDLDSSDIIYAFAQDEFSTIANN